jgi:PAS domain S-box-containing protein
MRRALIVDDAAQLRHLQEALLRSNGYQVASAGNGSEALEAARREPPDVVISDILMPVMDGFTLCRIWKRDPQLKSVPFVFYSATYTEAEDKRLALSLGADRFIIKPAEPEAFMEAIEDVVGKQRPPEVGFPAPVSTEADYLRGYTASLVRKLERKVVQLEESNRALWREIADRERIEQALRESEERFRRVVQRSPMPIAIVGEKGEILHLNEQFTKVLGYTQTDVPDLAEWWSRAVPDSPRDVIRSWQKEVATAAREYRRVEPREVIVTGKDGTAHTVELHVAPMGRDMLILFNDITERRRLEVLRDQFLAAAAHELKTPVTTIKGYSQLLLRWGPAEERPSREGVAISTIDAQCDRIQRRVDEMLAAARYRTGLAPIHAERIEIGELAHAVIRRLQATTDTHQVLFQQPSPMLVEAEPERLDEAMATLIDRMLRALPDGQDVRVSLWRENKEAQLSISGRGLVVPRDEEAAYFEPLYESRSGAGAGYLPAVELGPYLAKLAIERQKGRLWFERSEGGDAVFVVALPLVES